MNYGLYLSASGVLTNLHRQDVISNNLANTTTTAFKRQLAATQQRLPESLESGGLDDFQPLLDRVGGGVFAHRTTNDLSAGTLQQTPNDLDVAIHGSGFFVMQDANGQPLVTRDGRFRLDDRGTLIHQASGLAVRDANGQPITLESGSTSTNIDANGWIYQGNEAVAQLQLVDLPEGTEFVPAGKGKLRPSAEGWAQRTDASAELQQGYLEQSNVEPIREMVAMIEATRAITANANMIRYHDTIMDRAVNTLGRVS